MCEDTGYLAGGVRIFFPAGWCANFATVCEFSGQLAGAHTSVREKKLCPFGVQCSNLTARATALLCVDGLDRWTDGISKVSIFVGGPEAIFFF